MFAKFLRKSNLSTQKPSFKTTKLFHLSPKRDFSTCTPPQLHFPLKSHPIQSNIHNSSITSHKQQKNMILTPYEYKLQQSPIKQSFRQIHSFSSPHFRYCTTLQFKSPIQYHSSYHSYQLIITQRRNFYHLFFRRINKPYKSYTNRYTYKRDPFEYHPELKRRYNRVENILTVIIMYLLLSIGAECTNLDAFQRYSLISRLRSLITGVVYREDTANLRLLTNPVLQQPFFNRSPVDENPTFNPQLLPHIPHHTILPKLKDQFITTTVNGINLEFPIRPIITEQEVQQLQCKLNNISTEQELFDYFTQMSLITAQNNAFTATVIYDSYQLLSDVNNNITQFQNLRFSDKLLSLKVWFNLTRIRDYLAKEVIAQRQRLTDLTNTQSELFKSCPHTTTINSHNNNINQQQQQQQQHLFGTHFQTTILDQILQTQALAIKAQEFYQVAYTWGLFTHNMNDPRFIFKYSGIPDHDITTTTITNASTSQSSNSTTTTTSSFIPPDPSMLPTFHISFPTTDPLPWSVENFKQSVKNKYEELKQIEGHKYQSLLKQSQEHVQTLSQQLEQGDENVKEQLQQFLSIQNPKLMKPQDKFQHELLPPEVRGYSYKYEPEIIVHDNLRIDPFTNRNFINIETIRRILLDRAHIELSQNGNNLADFQHSDFVHLNGTTTAAVLLKQSTIPTFSFPYDEQKIC